MKNSDTDNNARDRAIQKTEASMSKALSQALFGDTPVAESTDPTQFDGMDAQSLTELKELQEEVARVIPAGNIVGLVLSGLTRLKGRRLPNTQAKSDVSALLRGLEMLPRNILPERLYGSFLLAGPAMALYAYQKLLTMAGKDAASAFPDGLWQFYLEFALREDSARHANETRGFQKMLTRYHLHVSEANQLAAWVCTVSQLYFQYDDLLYNEWRERVYLRLVEVMVAESNLVQHSVDFQRLHRSWAVQRPYRRGRRSASDETYASYRRRFFDEFLRMRLEKLPASFRKRLNEAFSARQQAELAAYQEQMTILATLDPERYRENRRSIPLWQANIGIIYQGQYYLLPAYQVDRQGNPLLFEAESDIAPRQSLHIGSDGYAYDTRNRKLIVDRRGRVYDENRGVRRGYLLPANFRVIQQQVAAILQQPATSTRPQLDKQLIVVPRMEQDRARKTIADELTQRELQALKLAPILINWDDRAASQPLSYIRRGRRGVGDHALTLFRTGESMVFDQSHIFFDGTWGMAVAEMLTSEASSWAVYLNTLEAPPPAENIPRLLQLQPEPNIEKYITGQTAEVSVESKKIEIKRLYRLCKLLPKRIQEIKLTVNDFLLLYRCEFSHTYTISSRLERLLWEFKQTGGAGVEAAYKQIQAMVAHVQSDNPAMMLPMDATSVKPRERLYPTTFQNPFGDLWQSYQQAVDTLMVYRADDNKANWQTFGKARRLLFQQLNYFGQLLRAYKQVAMDGESISTGAMQLFAHVPDYLLPLLDSIPQHVDVLNELLKGEEVFSNVGRVATGSSLSRFISAKDDNENKTLVWGFLTDDQDVLHVTLRDFRPHVATLHDLNRVDLAEEILADFLNAYVFGFNMFIGNVLDILHADATHPVEEISAP